ncbi:hypothetical protein LTR15_000882 [Elasticomyces elasticus]|nr:hypothetical protein LTR15_000882 [Elasticomyces elasticus]
MIATLKDRLIGQASRVLFYGDPILRSLAIHTTQLVAMFGWFNGLFQRKTDTIPPYDFVVVPKSVRKAEKKAERDAQVQAYKQKIAEQKERKTAKQKAKKERRQRKMERRYQINAANERLLSWLSREDSSSSDEGRADGYSPLIGYLKSVSYQLALARILTVMEAIAIKDTIAGVAAGARQDYRGGAVTLMG